MAEKTVLVDAHCFDGSGQGIVSYIQGIYSELLKDSDLDITFACHNIEKIKTILGQEAKIIMIPYENFLYRLLIFFPRLLRSGKYQFAHFQYILPFFLSRKVKYITTIHDIIPIDFPNLYTIAYRLKVFFLFGRAAKKSDIVCTVSDYSKERIAKRFKIDEEKIFITPNAVKNIFFSKEKKISPISKPYFLFVSRIEERKNHLLLLKVFVEKHFYEKYNLVFVGKNSSKNTLLYAYYAKLPIEIKNSINFISSISDEELITYYQNSDLFVYPSIAEGFGIPPLEAALANCKVVCSNATAMSDFSFFKKYSFSPYSQSELEKKISAVLIDENYPFEEIKAKIENQYSWKSSADVLRKVILAEVSK